MPSTIKYLLLSVCSQLHTPQRRHLASIFLFAYNFGPMKNSMKIDIDIWNTIAQLR